MFFLLLRSFLCLFYVKEQHLEKNVGVRYELCAVRVTAITGIPVNDDSLC
jgi:hypothetical protein